MRALSTFENAYTVTIPAAFTGGVVEAGAAVGRPWCGVKSSGLTDRAATVLPVLQSALLVFAVDRKSRPKVS